MFHNEFTLSSHSSVRMTPQYNLDRGRRTEMLKKTAIVTAIVVMAGILAVQAAKAETGRIHAPGASPCIESTDEQRALMQEYREKKQELRNETRKEAVDGERVGALSKELQEMRAAMNVPERSRHGRHSDGKANRPGARLKNR